MTDQESLPQDLEQIKKYISEGQFDIALGSLDEFEVNSENFQEYELQFVICKATVLCQLKEFDDANEAAKRAYVLSKELNVQKFTIDALNLLAISALAMEGMEQVNKYITEAEIILELEKTMILQERQEREAILFKIKGMAASITGDVDKAVEYYSKSLEHTDKLNLPRNIVELLNDLGESYRLLGNLDKARELFDRGFELAQKINYTSTLPFFCNNIGEIYRIRGELDNALKFYEDAIKYAEELGDEQYFCMDFSAVGNIYWQQGALEKAMQFLEDRLRNCDTLGSYVNASLILFILIQINLEKKQITTANENLEKLRKYAQSCDLETVRIRLKLAEGMILKTSLRARKRIQAEDIFKEIANGEIIEHEITILALLNLCDLLLVEFRITSDKDVLKEIQIYLDRLNSITMKQQSHWLLAETYLFRAKLALITLDLTQARRFLTQAQYLADEHGFSLLAQRISDEHDRVLKLMPKWNLFKEGDVDIAQKVEFAKINKDLEEILQKTPSDSEETSNDEPMAIIIIKKDGGAIFSYPFSPDWAVDEQLFSGFLTAFNSFSGELFEESLDRANFGQYTILMNSLGEIAFVYVYKGSTYRAQQKFNKLIDVIQKNTEIWTKIQATLKTAEFLTVERLPQIERILVEIMKENPKILGSDEE